ncbi:hypothetical protein VP01_4352g1 [Puccinia sorghi]|uniref:Uncharacterized protein n=1 Tax=Puccinia sorghi TaxID=27349 RepID=A0A0L6UQN0_9BASI|nr:hypothetical protein VP01_4352g1 [Puccinia sorghi]
MVTPADISFDHFKTKHKSLSRNNLIFLMIPCSLLEFKYNFKNNWMSKRYIRFILQPRPRRKFLSGVDHWSNCTPCQKSDIIVPPSPSLVGSEDGGRHERLENLPQDAIHIRCFDAGPRVKLAISSHSALYPLELARCMLRITSTEGTRLIPSLYHHLFTFTARPHLSKLTRSLGLSTPWSDLILNLLICTLIFSTLKQLPIVIKMQSSLFFCVLLLTTHPSFNIPACRYHGPSHQPCSVGALYLSTCFSRSFQPRSEAHYNPDAYDSNGQETVSYQSRPSQGTISSTPSYGALQAPLSRPTIQSPTSHYGPILPGGESAILVPSWSNCAYLTMSATALGGGFAGRGGIIGNEIGISGLPLVGLGVGVKGNVAAGANVGAGVPGIGIGPVGGIGVGANVGGHVGLGAGAGVNVQANVGAGVGLNGNAQVGAGVEPAPMSMPMPPLELLMIESSISIGIFFNVQRLRDMLSPVPIPLTSPSLGIITGTAQEAGGHCNRGFSQSPLDHLSEHLLSLITLRNPMIQHLNQTQTLLIPKQTVKLSLSNFFFFITFFMF